MISFDSQDVLLLFLPLRPWEDDNPINIESQNNKPREMKTIIKIILAGTMILAGCNYSKVIPKDSLEWTKSADLIFVGKILITNTSTIDTEDPSAMGVVSVDEILYSDDFYKSYKGQRITIILNEPKKIKTGELKIFFTSGYIIGESIAVRELGSENIKEKNVETFRKKILQMRKEISDEQLITLIKNTPIIVSGRIVSIKSADIVPTFDSEHNPIWMIAFIKISETLKGKTDKIISFLFPRSNDVMWRRVIQFKEGDEGIFLLRGKNTNLLDETKLTIINRRDFFKNDEMKRIKALIRK